MKKNKRKYKPCSIDKSCEIDNKGRHKIYHPTQVINNCRHEWVQIRRKEDFPYTGDEFLCKFCLLKKEVKSWGFDMRWKER